jgi:hypothetical protein
MSRLPGSEGLQTHPMATKEISPLRVWLFALVVLGILAVLGATLFVVLDDLFKFLADYRGFGTACCAMTTGRFTPPLCA